MYSFFFRKEVKDGVTSTKTRLSYLEQVKAAPSNLYVPMNWLKPLAVDNMSRWAELTNDVLYAMLFSNREAMNGAPYITNYGYIRSYNGESRSDSFDAAQENGCIKCFLEMGSITFYRDKTLIFDGTDPNEKMGCCSKINIIYTLDGNTMTLDIDNRKPDFTVTLNFGKDSVLVVDHLIPGIDLVGQIRQSVSKYIQED